MNMHVSSPVRSRIKLVDVARGLALIAMAIYHFVWDLDFFGYIDPGTSVSGGWRTFARGIAISFLFIVGFSLYLANRDNFRAKSYIRRLALILAAAIAITMATLLVTPNEFIYFGILHHIALASVLGLFFLKLPASVVLACGLFSFALPHLIEGGIFNHWLLWWTGIATNVRPSSDFQPLFPLFGVVLFGIAAAKLAKHMDWTPRLATLEWPDQVPVLGWIGQHSLAFYLIHQPVLISLLWLFSQVVPPPAQDQGALFLNSCNVECAAYRDEAFCNAYCGCLLDKVDANGFLDQMFSPDPQTTSRLQELANMCLMENTAPMPQNEGPR